MPKTFEGQKVMTPPFRISYPSLFEKHQFEGEDEAAYRCKMFFPKETDLSGLKQAAKASLKNKWGDKKPKKLASPFRDGDGDDFDDDNTKGMIVVSAKSKKRKPEVVDKNRIMITDPEDIYPGCWCRATLRAFAYDAKGNRGVSFALLNVQKLKDDEPFVALTESAEDDFDDEMSGGVDGGDGFDDEDFE